MTSVQLAQRLARHLTQTDLATLPGNAMLDILDAANAGLQDLYKLLPGIYKETALSTTLKAPTNVSVEMDAKYSNLLSSDAFTEDMRGCTVNISDDPHDNEITGTNSVLDGFVGNVLAGNAQIHHDAVPLVDVIERVTSDPVCYRADGTWFPLSRHDGFREGGMQWYYGAFPAAIIKKQAGQPRIYTLEPVGVSQGADLEFFFRVYPMPDTDYTVRFRAELAPRILIYPNITGTAVSIPVNDRLCNSTLVPLCEEHLLRSPYFKDRTPTNLKVFTDAAEKARDTARNLVARDILKPNNSIGTPGSVGNNLYGGCTSGW